MTHCDLAATDNPNILRGQVIGHAEPTWLKAQRIGDDCYALSLWWQPHDDCDPLQVGEGIMRHGADGWSGFCSEFAGHWTVTADQDMRVELTAPTPTDPEDERTQRHFEEPT